MRLLLGKILRWLGKKELLNFVNDQLYLKINYYLFMSKRLNLSMPVTLNEKLNWLKIYDRKEMYTVMVDKFAVKKYIADIIGTKYVIPTLGVWTRFDDIKFDALPNQFVLKCTHDCGSIIVCKDKNIFNISEARKKISKHLKHNYFWLGREWTYKNIQPRIIAEQYIEDRETKDIRDYKFYCFDGVVDSVLVCLGRSRGDTKFYFFDRDWNLKRYNKQGKEAPKDFTLSKPSNMDEMFELAGILSQKAGAPFVRVDLYNVNGKIYFGELTFYPDCGMDRNRLPETDIYFGNLVKLPIIKNSVNLKD